MRCNAPRRENLEREPVMSPSDASSYLPWGVPADLRDAAGRLHTESLSLPEAFEPSAGDGVALPWWSTFTEAGAEYFVRHSGTIVRMPDSADQPFPPGTPINAVTRWIGQQFPDSVRRFLELYAAWIQARLLLDAFIGNEAVSMPEPSEGSGGAPAAIGLGSEMAGAHPESAADTPAA